MSTRPARIAFALSCNGALLLLSLGCASAPERTASEDAAWLPRLHALSEMAEEGLPALTPDRVEGLWSEPLAFDLDPQDALSSCRGQISLHDEGWKARRQPRTSSTEFVFEPRRATPEAPCEARLSSISINTYRSTLAEAKQAGDELVRAIWPRQVPYPTKPSDENDPRWGRASEWDGWIKSLTYYYGQAPTTMGGVDVYLVKLPSGWRVSGELTAIYVETR